MSAAGGSSSVGAAVAVGDAAAAPGHSYPPVPEPLGVPVYDNHTHLNIFMTDDRLGPEAQLDRATESGVLGVVQVGVDLETSRFGAELAARDARVLAAVAIHPNAAPELVAGGGLDAAMAELEALARQPRVAVIGETGLDFYRTEGEQNIADQTRSFEAHLELAKQTGLPLQIHDRNAHEAVVATLQRVGAPQRTVFHCFSGDAELVRICAANGWFMSFAGNTTFKNAQELRDALVEAPRELLLVETDAPFLTPAPWRGRPNSPYLIQHTLRLMAEVRGEPLEPFAEAVAANTLAVYGAWDAHPVTAP